MRKIHLLLTLVALSLATTSLWAMTSKVDDGKLPGAFSVSSTKKVYFSQGNLQIVNNSSFRFASEQYETTGNLRGSGAAVCDQFYQNQQGWSQPTNGGTSDWHRPTKDEWTYIMNTRSTSNTINGKSSARYTRADITIDGKSYYGVIFFPDNSIGSTPAGVTWGSINAQSGTKTTCTKDGWIALEDAGCVFLMATGDWNSGLNKLVDYNKTANYLAYVSGPRYYFMHINESSTRPDYDISVTPTFGCPLRLVSNTAPKQPSSISVLPDADPSEITYDGEEHTLLSTAGTAVGGTMLYKVNDGDWSSELPKATDVGSYTIYYMVQGDATHKDYTPESNTITVTINKADIDVSGLSVTGNSLYATGDLQPLVTATGSVSGGTLKYSTDGINWSTDIPTESEVGTYTVYYMVEGDANHNDYTPVPAYITVSIDDYPYIADNEDPATKLTNFYNDGNPMDLKVKRTIYADDEYNTLCLPFALDESALAASPLAGFNRLKTFKGAQVTGTAPDLYIDIFVEDATTIEAGVPYLITYPSAHADIVDPVFTGITVTTTTPSATSADGVTFQGMFAQVHIDPYDAGHTQDYLFVGANSQLYWPLSIQTSGDIKMRGFRAYFIIDRNSISPALAPKGTRARIMDAPKTTTAIDNTSAKFGGSEKIMENGILYIIRNGVKYNAQGQVIK